MVARLWGVSPGQRDWEGAGGAETWCGRVESEQRICRNTGIRGESEPGRGEWDIGVQQEFGGGRHQDLGWLQNLGGHQDLEQHQDLGDIKILRNTRSWEGIRTWSTSGV